MLDRRVILKTFPPALNEVEKGAIRRFADAVGDPNPTYRDPETARAAGFRNLAAPPTFPATLSGSQDMLAVLGIAHRSVFVGEQSFEYHQFLCAGDRIWIVSRVVDLYEKLGAGGMMDFAVVEDEGRDEKGDLVFRARRTYIVRPPPKTEEEIPRSPQPT